MAETHPLSLSADRFSDVYCGLIGAARAVGEPSVDLYRLQAAGIREEMMRRIWFDQTLHTEALRTEDQRQLAVLSAGWWNTEAGPDFLNAEFRISDGPVQRGDVELHLCASGWRRHGHDRDPVYRSVGLHVILINDDGEACVLTDDGRRIPQVAIGKYLACEIEDLNADAPAAATDDARAPCRGIVENGPGEAWLGRFLDAAGDERMLRKAEQFERELAVRTLDQVAYEAIMEGLGYKSNSVPFRRLARRLPAAELRRFVPADAEPAERRLAAEAMLLGVAGLLEEPSEPDAETSAYLASLQGTWGRMADELRGRAMRRADWDFRATRPLNYPSRRLAGMAALLGNHLHSGLFRAILETVEKAQSEAAPRRRSAAGVKGLAALFAQPATGYWARRCTLGGAPSAAPRALVGRERAAILTVNVVVPLLLCDARRRGSATLEATVHRLYDSMTRLPENNRTRYVCGRLFGSAKAGAAVVTSARRQQGLIQLYADCCAEADATCERCTLLAAAGGR